MMGELEAEKELFDQWPQRYDSWFTTPIGSLVKKFESELLLEMLEPRKEERILDVGCGTGVFTQDALEHGASIVGVDISFPMLQQAAKKLSGHPFTAIAGNMTSLPFLDNSFDKVYSMTAIEFVADAQQAVNELNRVARRGAKIVLSSLNSLSPWAERRKKKAEHGHELFQWMTFRSPTELLRIAPAGSSFRTAIHFQKDDDPVMAKKFEEQGRKDKKDTGAFVAVSWIKQ